MNITLKNKNALITGGARGIGFECARILSQAGANVIIADIDGPGAKKAIKLLGSGRAIQCDLGCPKEIETLYHEVAKSTDNVLDILINNAGIVTYNNGIQDVSVEDWDKISIVNLRSVFLICQKFLPGMKQRKSGKIINFSSLAARVGGIEVGIHYSTTKAGLIGFTKSLAKEAGPYSINVNAVAPGIIETDVVKNQIAGHENQYTDNIPLRRLGKPEDVANLIMFLSSEMSSYITGCVIDINGGLYMG